MPPITNDCSLNTTTFLPSARAASSSSRMARSTRPHGLRTQTRIRRVTISTSVQHTSIDQSWRLLNTKSSPMP